MYIYGSNDNTNWTQVFYHPDVKTFVTNEDGSSFHAVPINFDYDALAFDVPAEYGQGTYSMVIKDASNNVLTAPALYVNAGTMLSLSGNVASYVPPASYAGADPLVLYKNGVVLHENVAPNVTLGAPGDYHITQGTIVSNKVTQLGSAPTGTTRKIRTNSS